MFLAFSVNSCIDQVNDPDIIELSEAESLEILNSPELQSFQANREKFIQKVGYAIDSKGYSQKELESLTIKAIKTHNEDQILEILFDTKENGMAYLEELNQSRTNLLKQYPILNRIREQEGGSNLSLEANATMFYGNFNEISKLKFTIAESNRSVANAVGDPVCGSAWNQVKVAACATACSLSTGGLGTVLCGWACWCTFCPRDSELTEIICAN